MAWLFGARRRQRQERGSALGHIVRRVEDPATGPALERAWSPRFEEKARLALTVLADALAALRASGDGPERAMHLAGTRDALDRVAQASGNPDLATACRLFGQILGAPGQSPALRLDAAALALDTLTFLVIADDPASRQRAAEALRQLERAAGQADAA